MPARQFALLIAIVILAAGFTVGLAAHAGLIGGGLGLLVLCVAVLVRQLVR